MAEKFRYTLEKPARLLFSSITEKSAPRTVQGATPKYSGTFGIEKEDYDAIVKIEVDAIKSEMGSFSGNAGDYYLACTSGETAAKRALAKAELDAAALVAKGQNDDAFKVKEKAEKRAELFRQFPGILTASSQYDVSLAKLDGGKIVDIGTEPHVLAQAGKDLFYPGAFVAAGVAFQGFRRKSLDAKDGVTAFLQNVLFIRKGERLAGSGPDNKEVFGGYANYSAEDPTAMAPDGTDQGATDGF